MMVVAAAVDGMQDAIGGAVKALTERVILSLVVVIAHITLVLAVWSVVCTLAYFDFFVNDFAVASCSSTFTRVGVLALPAAGLSVLLGERDGAVTVVSLSDIDVCVDVDLGSWRVPGVVLAVLDVDFIVARRQPMMLAAVPWLD